MKVDSGGGDPAIRNECNFWVPERMPGPGLDGAGTSQTIGGWAGETVNSVNRAPPEQLADTEVSARSDFIEALFREIRSPEC
jgi:hypothetical protein